MKNNQRKVIVNKKRNVLKETFGSFKFKRPIKEILYEGDKECWDENVEFVRK